MLAGTLLPMSISKHKYIENKREEENDEQNKD